MSDSEECLPCKIARHTCDLLDKDGKGHCQEIVNSILKGKLSGEEGQAHLCKVFGKGKIEEASKLAEVVETRSEKYKRSMLKFFGRKLS